MKAASLTCVLASVLLISACSDDSSRKPAVEVDPVAAAEQAGRSDTPPAPASAPAPTATAEASNQKLQAYVCSEADPRCRASTDPLKARSVDEARWLVAHGYPTREEEDRLKASSLDQLKAEADAGNPSAKVVYASKLALLPGKYHEGYLLMHDQAVSGNLYAYYGVSEVMLNNKEHGGLVDSAAYLRVAYLLGDWRAADKMAALGLPQPEMMAADRRAASLLNTFSGGLEPSRRPLE
jgi:hypothetical protein